MKSLSLHYRLLITMCCDHYHILHARTRFLLCVLTNNDVKRARAAWSSSSSLRIFLHRNPLLCCLVRAVMCDEGLLILFKKLTAGIRDVPPVLLHVLCGKRGFFCNLYSCRFP